MATRELRREEWSEYFDRFSRTMMRDRRVDYAEIRIFSEEIGAQKESDWLPLLGITYDPKNDVLEIIVDHLDHLVVSPETIYVDESHYGVTAIEVVKKDGTREVVEVR